MKSHVPEAQHVVELATFNARLSMSCAWFTSNEPRGTVNACPELEGW